MKKLICVLLTLMIVFPHSIYAKTVYELDDWEITGTGETGAAGFTSEEAYEGTYSVKVSNPGESTDKVRVINDVALSQGKYNLEFYAKGVYEAENVKIGGNWQHKKLSDATAETLENGWTKYTYTFTRIAANAKFNFTVEGNCDYIYIDNVSLVLDGTDTNVIANSGFESITETLYDSHDTVKDIIVHRNGAVCSISWTNPANNSISAVKLYKLDSEQEEAVAGTFSAAAGAVNTVLVEGLEAEKDYMWRIELHIDGKISDVILSDSGRRSELYTPTGWGTGRSKGTQGYTPFAADLDTSVSHSGKASIKFWSTQPKVEDNIYAYLTQDTNFETGGNYYVSFWMKADDAASVNALYNWNKWDGDKQSLIGGTAQTFDWTKMELYLTGASANGTFRMTLSNKMKGVWIDDFEAYKLDENGEKTGENLFKNPGFEEDVESTNVTEVQNVKAEQGNAKLTLSWNEVKATGGIRVYENDEGELKLRADLPATATGVTVKNLKNYENYTYVIKTVDSKNGESEGVTITAAPNPPDFEITKPVLYMDGKIADNIKAGSANVKMSATNFKLDTQTDVSLILVLYKDKEMVDCEIQTKTVGSSTSDSCSQQFDLSVVIPSGEGYNLDILVWDTPENMEILWR